jgi:putative Holliday junction resolvase
MGKLMAVDFGDVRTGMAFSDISKTLVGEAFVISDRNFDRVAKRICEEAAARGAEKIILGYPKNMNGTIGPRAEKSAALAEKLASLGAPEVVLWDERLTSVDANRILSESGKSGKKRKETVDAVAATLILEAYLGGLRTRQ